MQFTNIAHDQLTNILAFSVTSPAPSVGNTRTLANIAMTCTTLHAIARTLLIHAVLNVDCDASLEKTCTLLALQNSKYPQQPTHVSVLAPHRKCHCPCMLLKALRTVAHQGPSLTRLDLVNITPTPSALRTLSQFLCSPSNRLVTVHFEGWRTPPAIHTHYQELTQAVASLFSATRTSTTLAPILSSNLLNFTIRDLYSDPHSVMIAVTSPPPAPSFLAGFIAAARTFPNVQSVHLQDCTNPWIDALDLCFPPTLQTLALSDIYIHNLDKLPLHLAQTTPWLRCLTLEMPLECSPRCETMHFIRTVAHLQNLRELKLIALTADTYASSELDLCVWPALQTIVFDYTQISHQTRDNILAKANAHPPSTHSLLSLTGCLAHTHYCL